MTTQTCGNRDPGDLFVCTEPENHTGDHAAEDRDGNIVHTWPQVPADDAATAPAPPAQEPWEPGQCFTCHGRVNHAGVFHDADEPPAHLVQAVKDLHPGTVTA